MNNRRNKNDIASRISHTSFARLHRRLEAEYYVILLLKKKMNLHGKKKEEEGKKKKAGNRRRKWDGIASIPPLFVDWSNSMALFVR